MQPLMNGSFVIQTKWIGVMQEYGFTVTGSSECLREARDSGNGEIKETEEV